MEYAKEHVANEFFEIFRISLFNLRIFGVFPFSFAYQGDRIVLQTYSLITVLIVLLYSRFAYDSTRVLANELDYIIANPEFPLIIALIDEISLRCFFLLVPLYFWRQGRVFEELFNDWFDYQVNFECLLLTRTHSVMSELRRKIRWIVIRLAGPGTLIALVVSSVHDSPLEAKFVYFYTFAGQASIIVYWMVSSAYHLACVDIFLQTVQVKCKTLNSRQFCGLTELWIRLNNLIEKFYDVNSVLFAHQLKFMIVNGVTALYSSCMILMTVDGELSELQTREVLLDFRLFVACFCCIYVYSEHGYQLEKKINTGMRTELLKMDFTELAPAFVNEVWNLLRASDLKSQAIYLQKYMRMNREFFMLVLVAAGNFLIIFSQIDYGQNMNSNSTLSRSHIDTDRLLY